MNIAAPEPDVCNTQLRQTTCPYCGVGCGVDVSCNVSERTVSLDTVCGTPEHPANYGRLCVKGTNLLETNDLSGRLLHPTIAGEEVDWDTATEVVAKKLSQTIAEYGPDAVAFYVSGQLLTEDYYVANKLMKGFIGSANIDTNSRLCMSSAVTAYKRAFGEDVVPCDYSDLERTSLLILTGSNTAWAHPVLFQRIQRAKLRNPAMKVVVIDPRETETCTIADLHLPIKAGSDVALFNGLLAFADRSNAINHASVNEYTQGLDGALKAANTLSTSQTARCCDIDENSLKRFFQWFVGAESAVTLFSMGVNQSSAGVDKANAIINCHLALDFIAKPGCGPFSITGQPNAMGGREVGGLANMLAAHCDLDNAAHRQSVQTFWQSPTMAKTPGLKAVELFDAMEAGKVKFVWIMGTNPVVSMPNRQQVEAALNKCDTVVVSDIVASNDTLAFADIALAATGWSEKDGTVTNSERRISRQRSLVLPPGNTRHDWQIICDVAKKMGYKEAFSYAHSADIFHEHTQLTGWNNNNERLLNLASLSGMSVSEYNSMEPVQWPLTAHYENALTSIRPFHNKQFSTPNGKANIVAVTYREPIQQTDTQFPYVLNSGRSRDHWHTMTRTGKSSMLHAHTPNACLYVHCDDASVLQLKAGDYAALTSKVSGKTPSIFPIVIDSSVRKGEVFVPIHWSRQWGSHSTLANLYASATDPLSGQPELKHGAISISPVEFISYGKIFVAHNEHTAWCETLVDYWSKTRLQNGDSLSIADDTKAALLTKQALMNLPDRWVYFTHITGNECVVVATCDDALCFMMLIGSERPSEKPAYLVPDGWIDSLLGQAVTSEQISKLLHREIDQAYLNGPLVCSCFSVREKTIVDAISDGECSVSNLGKKLKCGTNCGSCKPAISKLIATHMAS